MKFKLLLLLLFVSSVFAKAQVYDSLIFSEVRIDAWNGTYAELCNMGSQPINLSDFEFGNIDAWTAVPTNEETGKPEFPFLNNGRHTMLPDTVLQPGATFVLATVHDWQREQHILNPNEHGPATTKDEMWELADWEIHTADSPGGNAASDSVSEGYQAILESWGGRNCLYLRHHFINPETGAKDSVAIDAVNNIFTHADNRRPDAGQPPFEDGSHASDVAGMSNATDAAILIRKYSVKRGNTDWDDARGTDISDSEWLPVPTLTGESGGYEPGRKVFWTVGNHGDYHLEDLTSDIAELNFVDSTLTVDWGVRNMDSIMNAFNRIPGIAWHYDFSTNEADSAYTSARSGDKLMLYAVGNTLESQQFNIVVNEPADSEARVVPKNHKNDEGFWDGGYTPYVVTTGDPVIDSIREVGFGERVDSLFKYLEKPEDATWEIDWVDDTERPDLILGDKLVVTAANGTDSKEYYIKVEDYYPSHNADLSAITWPDVPDFYKGILGWKGDTIPNFSVDKYNYTLTIPLDVKGIPNIVAKAANIDTEVEVTRAKTLNASEDDRTVTFHTIAEDDSTELTYNVVLQPEKDPDNVQPYEGEPFFTQIVIRENWGNYFFEIYNPGNQPLDMSQYVIVKSGADGQYGAISEASGDTEGDFNARYNRYVPGYIFTDDLAEWQEEPGLLIQDFNVDAMVQPHDVFVIGRCNTTMDNGQPHPRFDEIDVSFHNDHNPWGYEFTTSICDAWINGQWFLYKITNDSVLNGEKPLGDEDDVILLDVFGDGEDWGLVDGVQTGQNSGFKRLPSVQQGNTEPGASLGTGEEGTSEWLYTDISYWANRGYGWPLDQVQSSAGIGSHEINTITKFMSTVSSSTYIVSEGYSHDETIIGVTTGTTVSQFKENLIKKDENQTLTVLSDGTELSDGDEVSNGDVLVVLSDEFTVINDAGEEETKQNDTHYTLSVTEGGLDSDAMLTSDVYTIEVDGSEGTVSGFEPGTTLREVVENVEAPETALYFNMFNDDGSYTALTQLNFDTVYVDVLATNNVNFEVLAQDGATKITYELVPNESASDAFVYSNTFEVDQDMFLIDELPNGTSVSAFFENLTPSAGATIELQNKMGQVREMGTVYKDDKLLVTSQDGETQNVYSLQLLSDESASYLAFLYSESYVVSQGENTIVVEGSKVASSDFLDNISTSLGASIELLDADGNEKTAENMEEADQAVVTSADGTVTNTYTIVLDLTSVEDQEQLLVEVYPNPTSGAVSISGVEAGNTIRIFNNVGQNVLNMKAGASKVTAPLYGQPAGIYMILVNDGAKEVAKFKLIKK